MKALSFSSLFVLLLPAAASAEIFELRVQAVERERVRLPVRVELPGQEGRPGVVTLRGEQAVRTGQLEREGEKLVLYWIEPEIAAGEAPVYRVDLAERAEAGEGENFRFIDGETHRDLRFGANPIYRLMTEYDPARHDDTHKPYHHVFSFDGEGFITKGPGGRFPHHKGIYLGWNRTQLEDGSRLDFWHAPREYQKHREFIAEREFAGPVVAREVSVTEWIVPETGAVARDIREVTSWVLSEDERMLDFEIRIESKAGRIHLGGDAHHAGFQFRAADEVDRNAAATSVILPEGAVFLRNDLWENTPWMAISFDVGGRSYTVAHMDDPEVNPRPTLYSVRTYGRFGAFPVGEVEEENPLRLRYRILIRGTRGDEPTSSEALAARHEDFLLPAVVEVIRR